jgi:hypothetical protein
MLKVVLDGEEIKKAITFYVARKFQINADSVTKVDFGYSNDATVQIEEEDENGEIKSY